MAGRAVSYEFLDVLAKSVGMDAETVKQALAEINQLQQQTQALELAVQGKAPTNHSTDGVAVSPDAVYAYAPDRDTTPLGVVIHPSITLIIDGSLVEGGDAYAQLNGNVLSVSWGNTSYTKLNQIDIAIPAPYKYKALAPLIARTNAGVAVSVEYSPSVNSVLILREDTDFKPYDSILVLLAPDNS